MAGIDMADTVREVISLTRSGSRHIERIEARDKVFIVNHDTGEVSEVEPRVEDLGAKTPTCAVLNLASLSSWALAFGAQADESGGEMHLSRKGDSAAFFPRLARPHIKRNVCSRPFFRDFLPSGVWVDFEDFQTWLDKVRPGMTEGTRDMVDIAFGQVSATSATVVEMQVDGAVIQVDVRAGDKVSGKRQLPRHISSTIPFGDPDFKHACRFVISARIKDGKVLFRAVHDEQDGAYDAWLNWGYVELRNALPDGWVVLLTP